MKIVFENLTLTEIISDQERGAFDSAKNHKAPTPQAPVRNRKTRKVANAKVRTG